VCAFPMFDVIVSQLGNLKIVFDSFLD